MKERVGKQWIERAGDKGDATTCIQLKATLPSMMRCGQRPARPCHCHRLPSRCRGSARCRKSLSTAPSSAALKSWTSWRPRASWHSAWAEPLGLCNEQRWSGSQRHVGRIGQWPRGPGRRALWLGWQAAVWPALFPVASAAAGIALVGCGVVWTRLAVWAAHSICNVGSESN